MCIAIAKQEGLAINETVLKQCFDSNPDGAGFCVEIDGKLVIKKGYFTYEAFYEAYKPYEYQKTLIHFRIRTHGDTDEENCHPFQVTENIVFIHNGIITKVTANGKESDTRVFNSQYLQPIVQKYGKKALNTDVFKNLISSFIGYSKLCFFIKGQKDFLIYNEDLGNRSKEGIWFSNTSWQPYKPPVQKYPKPIPYQGKPKWKELNNKPYQREEVSEIAQIYGNGSFSFGTLVRTNCDINHVLGTIPKGTIGEVERVYADRTLDIDFYNNIGAVTNLYPYALDIIEEVSLTTITPLQ